MTFQPGIKPPGSGRKPGSVNKRTAEFRETLEKNNYDAAATLLELLEVARHGVQYGVRDERIGYLKVAADLAKEIARYCYPTLKSVELKTSSPYDGMTDEQKLEILKETAKTLEDQIVRRGPAVIRDVGADPKPGES